MALIFKRKIISFFHHTNSNRSMKKSSLFHRNELSKKGIPCTDDIGSLQNVFLSSSDIKFNQNFITEKNLFTKGFTLLSLYEWMKFYSKRNFLRFQKIIPLLCSCAHTHICFNNERNSTNRKKSSTGLRKEKIDLKIK